MNLLWRQEEGVFPVVEILPPGHAECDAFFVRAVELIGSSMWIKVGCDVWLLHILFSFDLFSGIWRRKGKNNEKNETDISK